MAHSEVVKRGDRYKRRICLVEYGKPFMDLKTPLEALEAIYDLLESESEFDTGVCHLIFFWGEQLRDSCISSATFYIEISASEIYCISRKIVPLPRN